MGPRDITLSTNPDISYLQCEVVNQFFCVVINTPYHLIISYKYKGDQNEAAARNAYRMIDVLAGFSDPLSGVLVHCSAVISDSKALCRGFRKIGRAANGLKKTQEIWDNFIVNKLLFIR